MNDARTGAARIRAAGRNPYETCAVGNPAITVFRYRYSVHPDGRIYDELEKVYLETPAHDAHHEKVANVLKAYGGIPALDVDELTVQILAALK